MSASAVGAAAPAALGVEPEPGAVAELAVAEVVAAVAQWVARRFATSHQASAQVAVQAAIHVLGFFHLKIEQFELSAEFAEFARPRAGRRW